MGTFSVCFSKNKIFLFLFQVVSSGFVSGYHRCEGSGETPTFSCYTLHISACATITLCIHMYHLVHNSHAMTYSFAIVLDSIQTVWIFDP